MSRISIRCNPPAIGERLNSLLVGIKTFIEHCYKVQTFLTNVCIKCAPIYANPNTEHLHSCIVHVKTLRKTLLESAKVYVYE